MADADSITRLNAGLEGRHRIEWDFLSVPGFDYAVSPDGSRLLALEAAGERSTVTLDVIRASVRAWPSRWEDRDHLR